jgi:hypothetical protein
MAGLRHPRLMKLPVAAVPHAAVQMHRQDLVAHLTFEPAAPLGYALIYPTRLSHDPQDPTNVRRGRRRRQGRRRPGKVVVIGASVHVPSFG